MSRTLVVGANGQLGTELVAALRSIHGSDNVVATDVKDGSPQDGPFELLDILDEDAYYAVLKKYDISEVYHLAALLSAKGEQKPLSAWKLNMGSLLTVLESGREQVKRIYWPSSIAVFGPDTPADNTPQATVMNPNTVYGISKQAGERWCEYYHQKFGVDVRSLRYPGLIGYKAKPGGGTTDYAVDVFWQAVEGKDYECFLTEDMELPMMYMDDAIRGTLELMNAPADKLSVWSSYNFSGISFTPTQLFAEIKKHFPEMNFSYNPDFRQKIAESWPNGIDDTQARTDWGWNPKFDLAKMTETMISGLKA